MLGLPNHGDRIKVWPMPGKRAHMDERPVDAMGGGRFLPACGAVVEWSPFHHSQLLGGALLLHPPPCEEHDHGERGQDDCANCGRTVAEAQQYDVHFAQGSAAAKAAQDSLPKHPHELELHPQSEAMAEHRAEEAKAETARDTEQRTQAAAEEANTAAERRAEEAKAETARDTEQRTQAAAEEANTAAPEPTDKRLPQITDAEQWPSVPAPAPTPKSDESK